MNKPTLKLPADRISWRDRASCGNCVFAAQHEQNDNLRYCRVQSPIAGPVNAIAIWPVTKPTDWCGQFND